MTTNRQLEANRCNARLSTGPKTVAGKLRSRRNALTHGLTGVTVVTVFEQQKEYDALEQAILADYMPRSGIETQLVLRLSSLLWRLRRAGAVEKGLIQLHAEIQRSLKEPPATQNSEAHSIDHPSGGSIFQLNPSRAEEPSGMISDGDAAIELARCFLRIAVYDHGLFERIGRYEKALWRQVKQLLVMLDTVRRDAAVL